ncbi:MAG: cold shock CspA family protein [Sulfurimonas sp.]|jgi:cold shock CspA family protein|uniref:hypothetical protein n=1 Tax=Sulfurimonas sp. TaxID=2022749 RepID=UPI0039E5D730
MIGKILEFNREKNSGLIVTESGNKYAFHISEYKDEGTYPKKGGPVEFMLEEESAIFIYPIKETNSSTNKNQNLKISMYAKVSLIAGLIGVFAFLYFAYNHSYVEKGYFYTIPSLFAILTGHISRKSKTASLGLVLGYIVTMMYIVVIVIGSFLS